MIEDSCSAIRAALAFMYNTLSGAADYKAKQIMAVTGPPRVTLDEVPTKAFQVEFAQKYGMLGLQNASEAALLEVLYTEIDMQPRKQTGSLV